MKENGLRRKLEAFKLLEYRGGMGTVFRNKRIQAIVYIH